jgi:5-methylcytosine-specific restriction endonuclease McrA
MTTTEPAQRSTQTRQTLVLDRGYQPISVVTWEDAVTLLHTDKAVLVEEYTDAVVRSAYLTIRVPAVIALKNAVHLERKPVKFSRVNIYGRDDYRCQYCGDKFKTNELTYDHVVPRSQGGRTTWTNIASACHDCNGAKGGRTPEQAKMRLLKKPVEPVEVPALVLRLSRESAPEAWRDYMYWSASLDQD